MTALVQPGALTTTQQLAGMGRLQQAPDAQRTAIGTIGLAVSTVGMAGWERAIHPSGRPLREDEFYVELKDSVGRLHSHNGHPGQKFSDGAERFFWHGVHVPDWVAKEPERITVAIIEAEDNAEVRRVMIERYGLPRYMQDCGAVLKDRSKFGELYKKNMGQHEEPLVFVKVKNSTPEPDGSIKDYFLRVPPQTKTAREGIAWTFGLREKEYDPDFES